MKKNLLIFGNSYFAQIAYEYFKELNIYNTIYLTVNKEYIDTNLNIPQIEYENINIKSFTHFFVAITYGKLNTVRQDIYLKLKLQGLIPASYISPKAFVHSTSTIGEHCFIFENNTIQPFVVVGENNIIWSGNHIGHHSTIGKHNFISSHVVIAGVCSIGDNNFFGINSSIANNLSIGDYNWINQGANITKNIEHNSMYLAEKTIKYNKKTAKEFFKVE